MTIWVLLMQVQYCNATVTTAVGKTSQQYSRKWIFVTLLELIYYVNLLELFNVVHNVWT